MITASTLVNDTLTLVLNNGEQITTAKSDHPKWAEIKSAYYAGNTSLVEVLISMKKLIEEYSIGQLSISANGVTYAGRILHTLDTQRALAFFKAGAPYQPLANYIEKKLKNPSKRAIDEMYNFMEHKAMPLTPSGNFIAYKGVQSNFYSIHGNKETVVLKGTVNSTGQILNAIGEEIEVERSSVDDNFLVACSTGLHAGSLSYATDWGKSGRVILVEINPADVVSVPSDCNCQKLRCCKYKVIGEYTGKLNDVYTAEFETKPVVAKSDLPEYDENAYDDESTYEDTDIIGAESDASPVIVGKTQIDESGCNTINFETNTPSTIQYPFEKYLFIQSIWNKFLAYYLEQIGLPDYTVKALDDIIAKDNIDSLDAVELCMAMEEEFGIEIVDEVVEKLGKEGATFAQAIDSIIREIFKQSVYTAKESPEELLQGFVAGAKDKEFTNVPKYIKGDETEADSIKHSNFILGYLLGYNIPKIA